jgi:two-component system cell cycle response regulator DivK
MSDKGIVLYIEDNMDNRMLVRRVLEADGFTVIECPNPNQAIALAQQVQPNIILMDINMPEVDGYTLTARMKSASGIENVPIIALTANVMRGDRERSLEAGCDGYIQKPIDIDTITSQIERYLRKH